MRILIVEDERALADAVARGLRREGMAVDVAYDGDSGHEKAAVTRYDVVVLDRDLPGMSGDRLCTEITQSGAVTRVLMLTASGTVSDRVTGLSLGADDYLSKPSLSWSPGCGHWAAEPRQRYLRYSVPATWCSILPGGPSAGLTLRWISPAKNSRCWRCCSPPAVQW
jgi:CheY-like chemotaxis protein